MLCVMKKKIGILFLLLTAILFSVSANEAIDDGTVDPANFDYFLTSDVSITYGEGGFRERILERTEGKRDPIGLVLTGGSARALAHIGVLTYLEEQDIEPDFIVANSMGSIIGLLYAAGLEPAQIAAFINAGDISNYFDITLPIGGGVLDPSSFKTLVQSVIGYDLKIEDLPIPVMVICDDLVTKREIRICEGNVADILIASFALPVYFPPQKYNGHFLIDGGVKSLAPINAAYDYSDTVIVSTTFYDLDTINLMNPVTILNSAFDVGKRQRAAKDMKTYEDYIWIRCNVEQFSFMDFKSASIMAERGYEAALAEADALSKLHKRDASSFTELRPRYEDKIEKAKDNIKMFNRIESSHASHLLNIGFNTFQTGEYPYYLRDSSQLGFEYLIRYKALEFNVFAGMGFDTINSKTSSAYPEVGVGLDIYPLSWMRLTLDGSALWDVRSWIPSVYAREGLDMKLWSFKNIYKLEFNQAFEYYMGNGSGKGNDRYLLSCELDNRYEDHWGSFGVNLGYKMTGNSFAETRNYMDTELDVRYKMSIGLFSDLRVLVRGAVDNEPGVPLFMSDGYVTNLNQENYGYMDAEKHPSTVMSLISISAGYAAPEFTLGEMLMFSNLDIGAYFDMLLYGVDWNFSTGCEIQSKISLIGLVEMPLRIRFGYDSMTNDFAVSTIFGVRY